MRDPDPIAAGRALGAVSDKPDLRLEEEHLHALVYSLTMAVQSSDISLRRAAAVVVARLRNCIEHDDLKGRVSRLEDILGRDISYSVRKSLGSTTSGAES